MKIFILLFLICSISYGQINFDEYFENKTLRIDYFETGNKETEIFSIDKLIEEPYWGGSKVNLVDTLFFGLYMAKVFDLQSNILIYSRGYSTLFAEWQTTEEAKQTTKSYSGTITIPYPKDSLRLEIHKRDRQTFFHKKFTYVIDPSSYFISNDRERVFDNFQVHNTGDYNEKLDIVFVPEGYTENELEQYRLDCMDIADFLFEIEPYREHKNDINIWGVNAISDESGSDIPAEDVWKRTVMNTKFYTFDTERYVMTDDYHAVRDVAANAPYDQIYILVNSDKYGGGAIYNYYSCSVTKERKSNKIFVHELGHGLAGLADEYVDPTAAYQDYYPEGIEPWEPNITTLVNFEIKWSNLLDDSTPIPTSDSLDYNESLGVFEGGGYVPEGIYRPSYDSIMRTLRADNYNEPSRIALEKVILFYAK